MKSVNFTVLGDQSIAEKFGKKGTRTDLALYDKKERDTIRTWVAPCGFPEKIQPLFQAIGLGDHVIFNVDTMDRFTGEQIVALDMLKKHEGILCHSYDVDEGTLERMIHGTVLEDYAHVQPDQAASAACNVLPVSAEGSTKIVIDHCFDVRGVGTVVLGKVLSGIVKQYDTLRLVPSDTDVMVKSIQMHDDPVDSASSPARVGLSLKGVRPEEISRGNLLCSDPGSVGVAKDISLDFVQTRYYTGTLSAGQTCMASIGLVISSCRIESTNPLKISFDRPVAHDNNTCILLKPESAGIRIMGSGSPA